MREGIRSSLINGFRFEELVGKIFVYNLYDELCSGRENSSEFNEPDKGLDLIIAKNKEQYGVEVKYFRAEKVPASFINRGIPQFRESLDKQSIKQGYFVVSSNVSANAYGVARQFGVELIGPSELFRMCAGSEELTTELAELIPIGMVYEDHFSPLEDMHVKQAGFEKNKDLSKPHGEMLIAKLDGTPKGVEGAKAFEEVVGEILKYLFQDFLGEIKSQVRTEDGLSVYDFICRIKTDGTGFWRFIAAERNSRYIVFECKNYKEEISQGQVLTTEKYLYHTANRSVAFIISRKGASDSAYKMSRGAMREHGKLILHLKDEDLINMLRMRDQNVDPSNYLFDITDELLMTLGR